MKKLTKTNFINVAKIVAEENGIKLVKSKIVLLESGNDGVDSMNYIMVEDTRNGKQYQMWKRDEVWTFQEYIQADDSSVELTELEQNMMKSIPADDFFEHGLDSVIWLDCFIDGLDMDSKIARGVLASLIKKGLIVVDIYKENGKNQSTMALTDEGQDWLIEQGIVEKVEKVEEIQKIEEETKMEQKVEKSKKETKKSGTRVILKAFTGMFIGEFEAIKVGKNLEVTTKSGLCVFDAKTLKQKNAKNPRFANKIEIVR